MILPIETWGQKDPCCHEIDSMLQHVVTGSRRVQQVFFFVVYRVRRLRSKFLGFQIEAGG